MAIKVQTNKVYKCISASIATASIHVIGGTIIIKGSNVTIQRNYKGRVNTKDALPNKDVLDGDTYDVNDIKKTFTYKKGEWIEVNPKDKYEFIKPEKSELVETNDELESGIHLFAGLPEWIMFEGNAEEIWIKAGMDVRFIDLDDNGED